MSDKNTEISRTKAEEIALFSIYDLLIYNDMKMEADVADIVSSLSSKPYEDCDLYVKRMVLAFLKHSAEIVPIYQEKMPKWKFSRLAFLEQALLFLAYCHFYYDEEKVSKAVVINFSVTLAKKYLGANDYKFVNAILDKILKDE